MADLNAIFHELKDTDYDLTHIRRALQERGLDENEIRIVTRSISNHRFKNVKNKEQNKNALGYIVFGIIILGIGIFITVGSYLGLFGNKMYYVIMYGPMLTGGGLIAKGLGSAR